MLRIDVHSSHPLATLYCSGNLVLGLEAETLRSVVQARHEPELRLNLSGLDKVDASGLGLLVELTVWASQSQRTLTLVDLPDRLWRLVVLTKLYAALQITYSGMPVLSGEPHDHGRSEMIA